MALPVPASGKRTSFLLAQLGAHAAARFADRTQALGLTPAEAGLLRLIGRSPGLSQRAAADRIGAVPSRIVALVDALQDRGLITRHRSRTDRRNHELHLTGAGQELLGRLRNVAEDQDAELLAALTAEEARELHELLVRLADHHQLDRDLHRGL